MSIYFLKWGKIHKLKNVYNLSYKDIEFLASQSVIFETYFLGLLLK